MAAVKKKGKSKKNKNKENDESKVDIIDSIKAGIFPKANSIETTMALSKRTKRSVHSVVHKLNWSGIFDKKLLPDIKPWKFDAKTKQIVEPGKDAWTIEVFSPTESKKLVELCELYGFEDCGYPKSYRSNTRLITHDPALADGLYQRIKQCCPAKYENDGSEWEICGLNERFRWCKYVKGQRFGMHTDARFVRDRYEKSFYTVNIYLNDGRKEFKGGRTCFYNMSDKSYQWEVSVGVVATPGLALMFNQWPEQIQHDGEEVTDGVKYLMRTDVMYKAIQVKKGKKGKK